MLYFYVASSMIGTNTKEAFSSSESVYFFVCFVQPLETTTVFDRSYSTRFAANSPPRVRAHRQPHRVSHASRVLLELRTRCAMMCGDE